jgi:hypothetical protein
MCSGLSSAAIRLASELHGHPLRVFVYPLPPRFNADMVDPVTGLCDYDRPAEYDQ